LGYFVTKIYLLCLVFIWVRTTLPRLRADQLMQFAWLILIPVTLGNIVVTALVYLVVSGLGAPTWVFLVALAAINWAAVFGFIQLVTRVTTATTRKAQAPAIRAQRRAATVPVLPLRDAVPQLAQPQSPPVTSGKE